MELRHGVWSRGITGTSLITITVEAFAQLKDAHSLWHNDETPKSITQFLNSLTHWTALHTMLETWYQSCTIRSWINHIKRMISLDVNTLVALPLQSNVSPDSLQIIEIGAELLQALPNQHRATIAQFVDSQIKALTTSSAHTPGLNPEYGSASHAVLESNDSGNELTATNSDHVHVRLTISHRHIRSRC